MVEYNRIQAKPEVIVKPHSIGFHSPRGNDFLNLVSPEGRNLFSQQSHNSYLIIQHKYT